MTDLQAWLDHYRIRYEKAQPVIDEFGALLKHLDMVLPLEASNHYSVARARKAYMDYVAAVTNKA